MKNDTLNGVLTFVLGVLVVLGVVFALRLVNVSHEMRELGNLASIDNNNLVRAQSLLNDTVAYNKAYPSPELKTILQSLQAKPAAAPNR